MKRSISNYLSNPILMIVKLVGRRHVVTMLFGRLAKQKTASRQCQLHLYSSDSTVVRSGARYCGNAAVEHEVQMLFLQMWCNIAAMLYGEKWYFPWALHVVYELSDAAK